MDVVAIILAAGEGTRMNSSLPKVVHPLGGKPIISYVIETVKKLSPHRTLIVLGHETAKVKPFLEPDSEIINQKEQKGTAHAVLQTEKVLKDFQGTLLVLCGDTPFMAVSTLKDLIAFHKQRSAAATVLTANLSEPAGYGRIIRDPDNKFQKIAEEKDASSRQKKIVEINSGTYCFQKEKLFPALKQVGTDNKQKEFYLTDVIEILAAAGETVCARPKPDSKEEEIMGINSRIDLAQAEKINRKQINAKWMERGVTLIDPDTTYIGPEVEIQKDTLIYPQTFLEGKTKIGKECTIGPCTQIVNSVVGDQVNIKFSVVAESKIKKGATIGPFSHLRPQTSITEKAKVGAFVEIKKSTVGEGSKVPHLSYIGDALIMKNVNVGAGTITCNYDGIKKHQTVIQDEAFLGSDTMLVAPVKVGKRAVTGAGSTITSDVPEDSLALERSEQRVIKDWQKKRQPRGVKK